MARATIHSWLTVRLTIILKQYLCNKVRSGTPSIKLDAYGSTDLKGSKIRLSESYSNTIPVGFAYHSFQAGRCVRPVAYLQICADKGHPLHEHLRKTTDTKLKDRESWLVQARDVDLLQLQPAWPWRHGSDDCGGMTGDREQPNMFAFVVTWSACSGRFRQVMCEYSG